MDLILCREVSYREEFLGGLQGGEQRTTEQRKSSHSTYDTTKKKLNLKGWQSVVCLQNEHYCWLVEKVPVKAAGHTITSLAEIFSNFGTLFPAMQTSEN